MEKLVVLVMKRAMMLLGAGFFIVCFAASAQAQCMYLLEQDNPDIEGFLSCGETVYGPPTETEMYMREYMQNHPTDIWQYLGEGPFQSWSWEDFYGCLSKYTFFAAGGNLVVWAGGGAVSAGSFVGATVGMYLSCSFDEIDWAGWW